MGNEETREQATAESRWKTIATGGVTIRWGFYKHDTLITAWQCDHTGGGSLLCPLMHIHAQHLMAGSM